MELARASQTGGREPVERTPAGVYYGKVSPNADLKYRRSQYDY